MLDHERTCDKLPRQSKVANNDVIYIYFFLLFIYFQNRPIVDNNMLNGKFSSTVSKFGVPVKSPNIGLRFITCSIYQMKCLCDGRIKLPLLFELIGGCD
jgi:hypothetical protein